MHHIAPNLFFAFEFEWFKKNTRKIILFSARARIQ